MKTKKCIAIIIGAIGITLLSGCSSEMVREIAREQVNEYICKSSGIQDDDNYKQYINLNQRENLDADGIYISNTETDLEYKPNQEMAEVTQKENEHKQVRVTFAQNSFLDPQYYYDSELKNKIDGETCYINPGESLFFSMPEAINPHTSAYKFAEFRVIEYCQGKRKDRKDLVGTNDIVLTLPIDFSGNDLVVEPIGIFEKKAVTFRVYEKDNQGKENVIKSGKWSVDGKNIESDNVQLEPGKHNIEYAFNEESYYCVSASPQPSVLGDNNVKFEENDDSAEYREYSVELHRYLNAKFTGASEAQKAISEVKINDEDRWPEYESNKTIEHLKRGDKVSITTKDNYKLFCSQIEPSEHSPEDEYTFKIPEECNGTIDFRIGKTNLNVLLNKSVGSDLTFSVMTSNTDETNLAYENQKIPQKLGADYEILDEYIGLENKIDVVVKTNKKIENNQAIKLDITKIDNSDRKERIIHYLSNSSFSTDDSGTISAKDEIEIYKDNILNNNQIYKSIVIKISLVPVVQYKTHPIDHGQLVVQMSDVTDGTTLDNDDVLEEGSKIDVKIEADEGYYVSGKDVKNEIYNRTMKVSSYEKDINNIISSHPIKKLIKITMDANDEYGKCAYTLDGKEIEGIQNLREGDKIKLTYKITDGSHQIKRGANPIEWAKNKMSSQEEREIIVKREMDGKTVTRSDFGIEVERK